MKGLMLLNIKGATFPVAFPVPFSPFQFAFFPILVIILPFL